MSRDPIGYLGGINLYEYCGDRPINNTDPSGSTTVMNGNYWDLGSSGPMKWLFGVNMAQMEMMAASDDGCTLVSYQMTGWAWRATGWTMVASGNGPFLITKDQPEVPLWQNGMCNGKHHGHMGWTLPQASYFDYLNNKPLNHRMCRWHLRYKKTPQTRRRARGTGGWIRYTLPPSCQIVPPQPHQIGCMLPASRLGAASTPARRARLAPAPGNRGPADRQRRTIRYAMKVGA